MEFKRDKKIVIFDREDFDRYSLWFAAEKNLRFGATRIAENFAQQFLKDPTEEKAYQFCKFLFKVWASQSGKRVFGNLDKKADFKKLLHSALLNVISIVKNNDVNMHKSCVDELNKITGLATSYSSKLLRFLYPEKFATLDSLLRRTLGYSNNTESFQNFINELKKFKNRYQLHQSLSEIEVVLFCICSSQEKIDSTSLLNNYNEFDATFITAIN